MIESTFADWQSRPPPAAHAMASPNLLLVLREVQRRWPVTTNMGCYGVRPIRGSATVSSSHSYGAAVDVGYPPEFDQTIAEMVAPWIVARSGELHVQAVHDYRRSRIWRAGRTANPDDACSAWWKAQRPSAATGMGQAWANHLHLEVTPGGWADDEPIASRWVE